MTNLLKYAEDELNRAGLLDEDSDYDGMAGKAVLDLVKVFSGQDHSGYSAMLVSDLFNRVSRYEPLSPITSDPSEWMEISEETIGRPGVWQSTRKPSTFSEDGGKTWYDIDEQQHDLQDLEEDSNG